MADSIAGPDDIDYVLRAWVIQSEWLWHPSVAVDEHVSEMRDLRSRVLRYLAANR